MFGSNNYSEIKPWHKFVVVVVILAAVILGLYQRFAPDEPVPTSDVPAVAYEDVTPTPAPPSAAPVVTPEVKPTPAEPEPTPPAAADELPAEFNLAVPFTSQAPFGNWDLVHEDTCEEASLYMAVRYYAGDSAEVIDTTVADQEMLAMVDAQTKAGLGYSITLAELQDFVESYYPGAYATEIIENPTIDQIKAEVAAGRPVIVPAAGRELGNPFFTGEGPLYHMLVIRGYTKDQFITNDPGTRHGKNYSYDQDVLMDAIGDWNSGDPANGAKVVMILTPAEGEHGR